MTHAEERKFIRHPLDIPIRWHIEHLAVPGKEHLKDISSCGLSFVSHSAVPVGGVIEINIPIERPEIKVTGRVVWCRSCDDGCFEVGVLFVDAAEQFRMRMVEQVCHIEDFKNKIFQNEGRKLTSEEAALEWIRKYAMDFPR